MGTDRLAAVSGDPTTEYWVAMAQAMTATYPPNRDRVLYIAHRTADKLGPHQCAGAAQQAHVPPALTRSP